MKDAATVHILSNVFKTCNLRLADNCINVGSTPFSFSYSQTVTQAADQDI